MISVIIPAYNVKKYLCQCINSIISFKELEIIVVNDGSVEDLSFVKEKYKNFSNFKYYIKENGGLSDARNYGLRKATQEYVMFLDGDDFIDTVKFKQVIFEIKNTKEKAYFFKYSIYYEKEDKIIKEKNYVYDKKKYISVKDKEFLKDIFAMTAWRYIVKRQILMENNLFFIKGIFHEDEEWTPKLLASVDRVYNLKENILFYRQRENSIMSSLKYKNLLDIFIIIKVLEEYKKSLIDIDKQNFICERIFVLYKGILLRFNKITLNKNQKKEIKKLLKIVRKNLSSKKEIENKILKYFPLDFLLYFLKYREVLLTRNEN